MTHVDSHIRSFPLRALLPLAAALLLAGLLVGCGGGEEGDAAEADSTAAADSTEAKPEKKEKAIKVNAAGVQRGDLVMPVYADGAIRTPRSVEIRTKAAGELTAVLVEDGDRVRAGQLLARIDPRQYALELEESRYRHLQALSQIAAEADTLTDDDGALADFLTRRDALQKLFDDGGIVREEYQSRLLDLEMESLKRGAFRRDVFEQRTGLADARVAEERAKLNLENTEIRAPFAGVVQGLSVVPGEIVSVSTPICSIFDNSRLEAVVNVLEADLGNLRKDRPARLAVPATGDTLLVGIDVISPTLDEASRTCEVIIRFDNADQRFRPGMFVRAEIAGWVHPDKLMVPKAARLMRDDRPLVFKVNGERAQWLYVTTGMENDDWVEILQVHSGGSLEVGDQVVVSDHLTLAHEAKIKIRKEVPPVDKWAFADAATGAGR